MTRTISEKQLLIVIIVLLSAVLLRPLFRPEVSHAQGRSTARSFYIEPGVTMLRVRTAAAGSGKVAIDLENGNVWGFPTTTSAPYPVDVTSQQPPTSKPFLLGSLTCCNAGALAGSVHRSPEIEIASTPELLRSDQRVAPFRRGSSRIRGRAENN